MAPSLLVAELNKRDKGITVTQIIVEALDLQLDSTGC